MDCTEFNRLTSSKFRTRRNVWKGGGEKVKQFAFTDSAGGEATKRARGGRQNVQVRLRIRAAPIVSYRLDGNPSEHVSPCVIIFETHRAGFPAVTTSSTSEASESPAGEDHTRWFAEEVQPHEMALRGYLRNKFPSIDTDDIVQESYFRLFKARAKGRIASSKAYIFAIASNTARTFFHRRRIYSSMELADVPDSLVLAEKSDGSELVNDQLRFQLALEAIDRLPPRCREIFRFAVLDRCSTAEIVRRTGLAENTVYAQLAIGVRKCSEFLRERGERK